MSKPKHLCLECRTELKLADILIELKHEYSCVYRGRKCPKCGFEMLGDAESKRLEIDYFNYLRAEEVYAEWRKK